jgi:exopolyphosphatase/guanosine-5'-triphosphate,3'-diphosphate pyrophosphatase
VDDAQAARVERKALALLMHAPASWKLDPVEDARLLAWAARLHEVGLTVSFDAYHRHSGYLVLHADMPGFARDEQRLLAAVVGNHRRRIVRTDFGGLSRAARERALRLIVILRLAVLLHRARGPAQIPPLRLAEEDGALVAIFPEGWLERHPLTQRDLEDEREHLRRVGIRLRTRA